MQPNNWTSEIKHQGFAVIECDPAIWYPVIDSLKNFYDQPDDSIRELIATQKTGVLGYTPSEYSNFAVNKFKNDKLKVIGRRYASFDFILSRPTYADVSLFPSSFGKLLEMKYPDVLRAFSRLSRFARSMTVQFCHSIDETNRSFTHVDCLDDSVNLCRILEYNGLMDPSLSKPHTDYELLSFIFEDTPGLEILQRDGSWRQAQGGHLKCIILAGDMTYVLSSGTILPALHRVRTGQNSRRSAVYFQGVAGDFELGLGPAFPLNFSQHLIPFLIRNCIHLQPFRDEICARLNLSMATSNPFKRLVESVYH